jgi:hypothetical protein
MELSIRDKVKPGDRFTADYLRVSRIDATATFTGMYKLVRDRTKVASDKGVISLATEYEGQTDTSDVFRVAEINPDIDGVAAEFLDSQTNALAIAAPGTGKRIVVIYASIRTESVSGEAWFFDGTTRSVITYFSAQTSFNASNLHIELPVNTPIYFNSTQGAKKVTASLQYYIEEF